MQHTTLSPINYPAISGILPDATHIPQGYTMIMRSFTGKSLLAAIRGGDFAHAGEKEAIELSFANIRKNPEQMILDVGCGRGGTAEYIHTQRWGKVHGFDIEAESIEFAQANYQSLRFFIADATTASSIISYQYDIICSFNVFYAINNKLKALKELRKLAKPQAQLVLFDYFDYSNGTASFIHSDEVKDFRAPIDLKIIKEQLSVSGWTLSEIKNLDKPYLEWYRELNLRIHLQKRSLTKLLGEQNYQDICKCYQTIYQGLKSGEIGGGVIYAEAS